MLDDASHPAPVRLRPPRPSVLARIRRSVRAPSAAPAKDPPRAMKPGDILIILGVTMLWGLGFTLAKWGFGDFPPIFLIALRYSVTALAMVWFVRPPWEILGRVALISVIGASINYSLIYTGLEGVDASTAALIIQLEIPFAAIVAAIFLRERLSLRQALGMALSFVGTAFIVGEPKVQQNLIPVMLLMVGAFCWAAGQAMVRKLGKVDPFALIAWMAIFGSPQLFLTSYLFESGQWEALENASWQGWGVVFYLGVVMNGLGYGLWYRLLGRYTVNTVMPYQLLVPVITVLGGVLLLGEEPTFLIIMGGAIVILGVAFITIDFRAFGRR
ncbi:MAG: DMT family transporter [Alphaproteobacteria bacterium]